MKNVTGGDGKITPRDLDRSVENLLDEGERQVDNKHATVRFGNLVPRDVAKREAKK